MEPLSNNIYNHCSFFKLLSFSYKHNNLGFVFCLKYRYGRYLGVSTKSDAILAATADAVGVFEQFEPIFQDGRSAMLGANNCFLSADPITDDIIFKSQQAKTNEMVIVCNCCQFF